MTFSIYYRKKKNQHLFQSLGKSDLGLTKMQNYIPIYDRFFSLNETNKNLINLNSHNYITHFHKTIDNHTIHAKIMNSKTEKDKDCEIFIKYGPLLDPLKYLAGKYVGEDISTLPSVETNSEIDKINDYNNSAYVDSFMTYLTSNLLHHNSFFHGLDFYGSFLGIKKGFEYDIVDDMEAIHNNSFFHKNNKNLFDLPDNIDTNYFDNSSRNYKNRLTIGDCDSVLSISSFESDVLDVFKNVKPSGVIEPSPIIIDEYENICESEQNVFKIKSEGCDDDDDSSSTSSTSINDDSDNMDGDEEHDDSDDYDDEYTDCSSSSGDDDPLIVRINEFPCQAIFLEKCHNTLDTLMMSGDLSEPEWISALFQINIMLYTYQKCFQMTHNDLHTNNVMYINTEKKFLYYCVEGVHYKVPTHGRIYKIIDFGRAIYKFEDKVLCSDSYHSDGDAATQYNCEPYFNKNKPRLDPNMSFDLSRLACSIFDFFIEDMDDVDKIKKMSPTFSIINDWVTDDKGRNILYKQGGEERYPDFKLYKMIARTVHNHCPKDQFTRPQFEKFKISKKKINKKSNIMNIDKMPVYYK